MIRKILVANRGDRHRVMRTAKKWIATVAVYSEADKTPCTCALQMKPKPVLGPPPSNQSYLLGDKIITVAKETGADAIHPGYSSSVRMPLSPERCRRPGSSLSVRIHQKALNEWAVRSKPKQAVKDFNSPMVPMRTDHAISDIKEALDVAEKSRLSCPSKPVPVEVGKGMRVVQNAAEMEEQMHRAMSAGRKCVRR